MTLAHFHGGPLDGLIIGGVQPERDDTLAVLSALPGGKLWFAEYEREPAVLRCGADETAMPVDECWTVVREHGATEPIGI